MVPSAAAQRYLLRADYDLTLVILIFDIQICSSQGPNTSSL